jgi:hypothetical protein
MTAFVSSKINIIVLATRMAGLKVITGGSFGSLTKAIADNSFSPMAREP